MTTIDAPTGFADQVRTEGVNQRGHDARRRDVIAVGELAPAVPEGAENLAIAIVTGVFLEQADVGRSLRADGVVDTKDCY